MILAVYVKKESVKWDDSLRYWENIITCDFPDVTIHTVQTVKKVSSLGNCAISLVKIIIIE